MHNEKTPGRAQHHFPAQTFAALQAYEAESGAGLHIIIVSVFTAALVIPFSGKAFHMDDPLFLWTARHVFNNPFDFYGFDVNWYGVEMPMWLVNKNPPFASYYLAVAASVFGWGERAMHLSLLVPAIGAATGAYMIARRFTSMPLEAALIGIATPVFLVSATNVMTDITMLALWCWAIVLWLRGTENGETVTLIFAGLLAALSALTKYFGISLVPLLAVYALARRKNIIHWAPGLILAVIIIAAYQWLTKGMYGKGLLLDAVEYSSAVKSRTGLNVIEKGFIGMAFAGGCLITVLFYSPIVWGRKAMAAGALVFVAIAAVLLQMNGVGATMLRDEDGLRWRLIIQLAVFAAAGINTLALTIADVVRHRDSRSLFLLLWVFGTLTFVAFFNWTASARALLPIAPVSGILLTRAVEGRIRAGKSMCYALLIPGLVISLTVSWADYRLADSVRKAANQIMAGYSKTGPNVWFEGHWGFQYYMERAGARALDMRHSMVSMGDTIVIPLNNTNIWTLPEEKVRFAGKAVFPYSSWFTLMSMNGGAGFYSSVWGLAPYIAGGAPEETYIIMYAREDFVFN